MLLSKVLRHLRIIKILILEKNIFAVIVYKHSFGTEDVLKSYIKD